MRKIRLLIFSIFSAMLIVSCEKEFNTPQQAKNEVSKEGLKDGRWVEYILAEEKGFVNDTLGDDEIVGYRLIDYKLGFPKSKVKEFYYNGAKKLYNISLNEPARLDRFPIEKFLDTVLYESKNFKKVLFYNDDSVYIESQRFDSINGSIIEKQIRLLENEIPKERQEVIDKIQWKYLSSNEKEVFELLEKSDILRARYWNIIKYDAQDKIDTLTYEDYLSNKLQMEFKTDDFLRSLEELSVKQKNKKRGRTYRCKCCGKSYNDKYGWVYRSGSVSQPANDILYQMVKKKLQNAGFNGNGRQSSFCSKRCAIYCGPYN